MMSQGELFKDEVLRTADAVKDLELRLTRLTNEVHDLAHKVMALRPNGLDRGQIEMLQREVEELGKWRERLERRQDVLADGVEMLHRPANLRVVK